jgi:hypothetical protein
MSLNYKEVGQVIRVNVGSDITSATTLTLKLLPQVGDYKEITTGVTAPAVTVTAGEDIFTSGEYIEYTTLATDLDYIGLWKKKAVITNSATDIEQTNYESFRVLA